MSDAVLSINFDKGSMDRLRRTMQARQKVLNEDIRKTLTKTSIKVLMSLRASARVSPKVREVTEEGKQFTLEQRKESFDLDKKIQDYYKSHGSAKNKRGHLPLSRYIPRKDRGGWVWSAIKQRFAEEHKLLPIYGSTFSTTESEAKKSNQAKIQNQKLAYRSFGWIMGKLGHPEDSGNFINGIAYANKGQSGNTLYINLENRLRYIFSALHGGKMDVSSALSRARNALHSETVNALKKMAKAK